MLEFLMIVLIQNVIGMNSHTHGTPDRTEQKQRSFIFLIVFPSLLRNLINVRLFLLRISFLESLGEKRLLVLRHIILTILMHSLIFNSSA